MHKNIKLKGKRRQVKCVYSGSVSPCQKMVDISRLKDFAEHNLPIGTPLREVVICEKNTLSAKEFLDKLPIWLKLNDLYCKYSKEKVSVTS